MKRKQNNHWKNLLEMEFLKVKCYISLILNSNTENKQKKLLRQAENFCTAWNKVKTELPTLSKFYTYMPLWLIILEGFNFGKFGNFFPICQIKPTDFIHCMH